MPIPVKKHNKFDFMWSFEDMKKKEKMYALATINLQLNLKLYIIQW